MKQILESEGHDTSNLGAHDYPVQMMFDLDEGMIFTVWVIRPDS